MVVAIIRPDNFAATSGSRIIHGTTVPELLQNALEAYGITLSPEVEARLWLHPMGVSRRRPLTDDEPLEDATTLYLRLRRI
jgi:hypothetical protein